MNDADLILSTVASAAGAAQIIEYLKHSPHFDWLLTPKSSARFKFAVGLVMALMTSAGIHYEWNEATRTIAFTIPTTPDLVHHLWDVFVQWSLQQASYNALVKKDA